MEEHFNKQGKIFSELYGKYGFNYPFHHSLSHCYSLIINELYKPMVCLYENYGVTTTHIIIY